MTDVGQTESIEAIKPVEKDPTAESEASAENTLVAKKYVLRIISGPHSGAEVELQSRPIILGKGETCDIILVDECLQDQHAGFSIVDNKIICEPQKGAKVFIGGIEIHEKREINEFQSIVCGNTLMAIGQKDSIWPAIAMPSLKSGAEAQAMEAQQKADVERKALQKQQKKARRYLLRISIGLLILFGLIGIGLKISHKRQEKLAAIEASSFPIVALKESIETVLQQHHVDMDLAKIALSGKRFVLQCYVATTAEKAALEKILRRLPKVEFQSMHIFSQEKMIQQSQEVLNAQQTLIATSSANLDGILIKGYLYSIDQLPAIKQRLLTDIPGLHSIETALFSPDEVYELASNLLTQCNLMGLLKIQPVRTGVMVMGNIQASDEPRWKQAQKTLKKSFKGICKVLSYVATVAPEAVKQIFFPSSITTVSIPKNEKPWIDLKNGDRYFEGALLPSSYKIQSITQKEIRLQKNEEVVVFTLKEL